MILVTGSSGHLGEAVMRTLRIAGESVLGVDIKPSQFTDRVGSIADRAFVHECLRGVTGVIHTASRRGCCRTRRRLRLHEHDERVRCGADPGTWRASGMGDRRGRADPEEYLRRKQICRRERL